LWRSGCTRRCPLEIRNSTPSPPLVEWEDAPLLEELCLALRDVGVSNLQLPDGEGVRRAISRVKELSAELKERDIDVSSRIARLSSETNWDMDSLLRQTLSFPRAVPYLASTPNPTCGNCGVLLSRKAVLALCPRCVAYGLEQLAAGRSESHLDTCPICGCQEKGFLVYAHGLEWMNYCRSCLEAERARQDASWGLAEDA
jgi:hypothetical protein